MGRAVGIDLGTTNSVIAVDDGRSIQVLRAKEQETYTPSVVGYSKPVMAGMPGELLIGRHAYNRAARQPDATVFSIKRLMGRRYDDPKLNPEWLRSHFAYTVRPRSDADQSIVIPLGDRVVTPIEVSALILKKLCADAREILKEDVTDAVITVPAYFTEAQRDATVQAGVAAGLSVMKIIDEPTAAAIAFGFENFDKPHRALVYDLGGGTFDLSLIQIVGDNFEVLDIAGDNWLGGDDFDRELLLWIHEWVKQHADGYDPVNDKRYLALAKQAAEKAKIELSGSASTVIDIPSALRIPDGEQLDIYLPLSRADFEQKISRYVDKTRDLVRLLLERQNMTADDLTAILLVGGSTLVPAVRKTMTDMFGEEKIRSEVDPMHCVAIGAARLACRLPREVGQPGATGAGGGPADQVIHLGEVTAHALGVQAIRADDKDHFAVIVEKGTRYPLPKPMERLFRTSGSLLRIPVLEGDSPIASKNDQQGQIEMALPSDVPMGSTFTVVSS